MRRPSRSRACRHLADVRHRRDVPPDAAGVGRPRPPAVVRALPAQHRPPAAARSRAPTTSGCTATRRCGATCRSPHPELQLASVIAFVDFTRENGATRVVPGSHRWPDRQLSPIEQIMRAAARPETDRVRRDAGRLGGRLPRRHHPRRRRQHHRHRRAAARTSATASAGCAPRRTTTCRCRPTVAAKLPRQAQELLGYAVHDSIPRGGGYLGMVRMQDPVELLARGEL